LVRDRVWRLHLLLLLLVKCLKNGSDLILLLSGLLLVWGTRSKVARLDEASLLAPSGRVPRLIVEWHLLLDLRGRTAIAGHDSLSGVGLSSHWDRLIEGDPLLTTDAIALGVDLVLLRRVLHRPAPFL
jgi:hypothetical protein